VALWRQLYLHKGLSFQAGCRDGEEQHRCPVGPEPGKGIHEIRLEDNKWHSYIIFS
jgi:hypothetical protein